MRIFYGLEGVDKIKKPVITIGTFDGVHLGHQKIIENLVSKAKELGGESVLMTFSPHPRMVLFPDSHSLQLIQTEEEKMKKLAITGIENCIVFPFTFEFSRLSAMEFVRDILVNTLNIDTIIIGYDHQFGRNREGNIQYLQEVSNIYDFHAVEIPAQEIDAVNVSSTKIRRAILDGDIELANQYLGNPYVLTGVVVPGNQLGRTIGFPTANIQVEDTTKIIPGNGVYLVKINQKNSLLNGVMNIGTRPTVSNKTENRIEIHIFDFNEDLYDQQLEVEVLKKVRDEKKFDSIEQLSQQIEQDTLFARQYFSSKFN
jgi:riboflavin kinase/FMN adenylyltransferase